MRKELNLARKCVAITKLESLNEGHPSKESATLFKEVVTALRGAVADNDAGVNSLRAAAAAAGADRVVDRAVSLARLSDAADAVSSAQAFAITRKAREGLALARINLIRQIAAALDAERV